MANDLIQQTERGRFYYQSKRLNRVKVDLLVANEKSYLHNRVRKLRAEKIGKCVNCGKVEKIKELKLQIKEILKHD